MKQYERNFQNPLPDRFYQGTTQDIAQNLLGKGLVVSKPDGTLLAVQITEVEAYLSKNDPASHSHRGPTHRNQTMFERAGTCYIYLSYGIHYCVNVVTQKKGVGEAILIRSAVPLLGLEIMQKNRNVKSLKTLLNGPGKVTQAMGIDLHFNGMRFDGKIRIIDLDQRDFSIGCSPRIGISKAKDLQLRYFIKAGHGS